jgi:stage V sporulation protein B
LAVPVFSLIPALITPIALVSVPQLSASMEANAVEDQATVVERSLRLTTLFSIPSAMGISVYAQPILSMLFVGESEAIAIAAPLLAVLGISIPFSGLITTTNALLQSCRQMGKPILSMSIGATVKLLSAYLLLGDPRVGIYGAPISTLLCNLVVTGLNLIFLRRALPCVHQKNAYKQMYWKPTFAAILAILASLASYLPIRSWSKSETLAMLSAVVVAGGVYVWLLILMRALTQEDWALLPMGTRIRDKMEEYKNKKIKIKDGMKHDS